MARKPYIPFDWYNAGEPLTPYIAIKFNESMNGNSDYFQIFPNNTNQIYVENATMNVFSDNGNSTANVTLFDPNFTNLEELFLKALFISNSIASSSNYWFCALLWGWTFYGLDNDGQSRYPIQGGAGGPSRSSGLHYYILKSLSYDIEDVGLRVSFDLQDVGGNAFGSQGQGTPKITVGNLSKFDHSVTYQLGGQAQTGSTPSGETPVQYANRASGLSATGATVDTSKPVTKQTIDFSKVGNANTAQSSSNTNTATPASSYKNIFPKGTTHWHIIQVVYASQGITAIPFLKENEDKPDDKAPAPYSIPADEGFKEVIESLVSSIAMNPKEDNGQTVQKKWEMLSGSKVDTSSNQMQVVYGWIPVIPKGKQIENIDEQFRLARTFVFRPGYKEAIAAGESLVKGLSYDWTSKGYWGVGLPSIYAIATDSQGNKAFYTSEEDFTKNNGASNSIIYKTPTTDAVPINEFAKDNGLQVKLNFDSRTMSKDEITLHGKVMIVNVWNMLLKQMGEVSISIMGDPWIDNSLYASGGGTQLINDPRLINIYDAYFKVKVYRYGVGNTWQSSNNPSGANPFLSEILSGDYFCNISCTHTISEGEYTTSLKMMRIF